nr:hypothetical protein L204_03826 [Cryptococcus depauperatus CBS 7855]
MPFRHQRRRAALLLAATLSIHIFLTVITRRRGIIKAHRISLLEKRFTSQDTAGNDQSLLQFPYLEWYNAFSPHYRPLFMVILLCILAFLFSFIGISASDFFCPNLATVAAYLGLNESTAGVTFLAFGNGSPDVFSTFSAMSNETLGLAVGELIGAASFIISIVVGSIALMGPFNVPRHAFLRDVFFFTTAVVVLMLTFLDGRLSLYESGGMVGLYLLYVGVVVGGNWWNRKERDRKRPDLWHKPSTLSFEALAAGHRTSPVLTPINRPNPTPIQGMTHSSSLYESPIPIASPLRPYAHSHSFLTADCHHHDSIYSPTPRASMSLLGAIEFRDVVNSLRQADSQKSSRSNSSSLTPTPGNVKDRAGDYFSLIKQHRHSVSQGHGNFPTHRSNPERRRGSIIGERRPATQSTRFQHEGNGNGSSNCCPITNNNTELVPSNSESNPWTDQPGKPPDSSPLLVLEPFQASPTKPKLPKLAIPESDFRQPEELSHSLPLISVVDPLGQLRSSMIPSTPPSAIHLSRSQRVHQTFRSALRVLFPSLQAFRHKSLVGMILAVMSVPAILALTLTLPVVDDGQEMQQGGVKLEEGENGEFVGEYADNSSQEEDLDNSGRGQDESDRLLDSHIGGELHHLVDHGFSPLHSPLGRIRHASMHRLGQHVEAGAVSPLSSMMGGEYSDEEEQHLVEENEQLCEEECARIDALNFNKYLCAAQCVLGPLFCTFISFQTMSYFGWILIGSAIVGVAIAILVLYFAVDGTAHPWRLIRCFCGFVCSMVWIAAIADQVVDVLATLGEILGLSDAIIGLTSNQTIVFAVGNSLADLIANVTVAQFAPAMAYAACFGGPMLNLLLGVGGSGSYHIITSPSRHPVIVNFSPTLWVSATGLVTMLVATAIFVPLNGYKIDRRWATFLILGYIVLMTVNICVELKFGRN